MDMHWREMKGDGCDGNGNENEEWGIVIGIGGKNGIANGAFT